MYGFVSSIYLTNVQVFLFKAMPLELLQSVRRRARSSYPTFATNEVWRL